MVRYAIGIKDNEACGIGRSAKNPYEYSASTNLKPVKIIDVNRKDFCLFPV